MRVLSLFSGGGLGDYGLELAGIEIVGQVEIDDYCQKILKLRWPDVPKWTDIKNVTGEELPNCEIISGGFPCQDVAAGGSRDGLDGDKSGLWREMFRIISVVRPGYVIVENVATLLFRGLAEVLADFTSIGYDTEWETFSSRPFGTDHKRIRTWIIAYPASKRLQRRVFTEEAWKIRPKVAASDWWTAENRILRKSDRFAGWIPKSKIIGNGQVVQVVEWIGNQIMAFESPEK